MNLPFNTILQKLLPYIFVILGAYIITTILFLFLPKSGVDFTEESTSTLKYKKYSGFYSRVKVSTPKIDKKIKKKNIQTLSKYQLKAVYSTTSNGGWASVEEKSSSKSTIIEQYEKFNGYTLTKLYKNYVIFEKNLKEFKLELPLDKEINYEIKRKTVSNVIENVVVNEDNIKVKRDYLNSYVNDIEKVWNNIAISDIRKNGKIDGFKINSVNKDSVFGKLGLRKNDIIKSINNQVITSYADAFKIYNEINNLDYLNIEVLRNNEIVELNYEID